MKYTNISKSEIKTKVEKLKNNIMYNISINEVTMASTWTKAQSVEISDIKSAILANAEVIKENREAIKENREAIKENREAIKENREAIRALDHKIDAKIDEVKQEFKSEINNLENRLINVLARNGIK